MCASITLNAGARPRGALRACVVVELSSKGFVGTRDETEIWEIWEILISHNKPKTQAWYPGFTSQPPLTQIPSQARRVGARWECTTSKYTVLGLSTRATVRWCFGPNWPGTWSSRMCRVKFE